MELVCAYSFLHLHSSLQSQYSSLSYTSVTSKSTAQWEYRAVGVSGCGSTAVVLTPFCTSTLDFNQQWGYLGVKWAWLTPSSTPRS